MYFSFQHQRLQGYRRLRKIETKQRPSSSNSPWKAVPEKENIKMFPSCFQATSSESSDTADHELCWGPWTPLPRALSAKHLVLRRNQRLNKSKEKAKLFLSLWVDYTSFSFSSILANDQALLLFFSDCKKWSLNLRSTKDYTKAMQNALTP